MKVLKLDLFDRDNSDISYRLTKFPDGQQSIEIQDDFFYRNFHVEIVSRLNSFMDLELIICAKKALDNQGATSVSLYTPYFLGARSDRRFEAGSIHYLKDVICPIINSLNFTSVRILDPHSDVLEACLNNIVKINNHDLVKDSLIQIDNRNGAPERVCLISPDAGAYKKIFDVAKKFNISNIVTATKVRDLSTGKILHTEVPLQSVSSDLKYVIVDDICDGGRTFIEIAKVIKYFNPNAEIYLVVTHGIFSAGFTELGKYFNRIFCTNSVSSVVKNPEDTDIEAEMKAKVQQLNVSRW